MDQSTYCRVLLHGGLAVSPGTLAAFRLSSTQWSVSLAREQARSAAAVHRQIADLAPGLLSSRDIRVGNARARVRRKVATFVKNASRVHPCDYSDRMGTPIDRRRGFATRRSRTQQANQDRRAPRSVGALLSARGVEDLQNRDRLSTPA